MYLLDTNVISELRKAGTSKMNPQVHDWAQSIAPTRLFLSVISILEIEQGILSVMRLDKKQGQLLKNG